MSARAIAAGSQPAIEVRCDWEPCNDYERVFLDDKRQARQYLSVHGWTSAVRRGYAGSDYCPQHAGTPAFGSSATRFYDNGVDNY